MPKHIFVTGIGTGIGKTLISAILARALEAEYWKPIQAGIENGTDSDWVRQWLPNCVVHPETYKLKMAASPHIAAREEGTRISIRKIAEEIQSKNRNLIIEGPGGLLVPLNENEFVTDLITALDVKVVLVSRNYLGSINHSLLTSEVCKQRHLPVSGWIFNDQYLSYEQEIVSWTAIPRIASVPFCKDVDGSFIEQQANLIKERLALYD